MPDLTANSGILGVTTTVFVIFCGPCQQIIHSIPTYIRTGLKHV